MPDIGPTVDGVVIESYVRPIKAYSSVAACPIGGFSQTYRSEFVAAATPDAQIIHTGPICEAYDPELAAALGFEL